MSRTRYTDQQLQFLAYGYRLLLVPDLTKAFNARFGTKKTPQQIKSTLSNHNITCGRPNGTRKGTFRLFNSDQVRFIDERYKLLDRTALTAALNEEFETEFSVQQVATFVHNHGIDSGRTGCFSKGHMPWNTGTKGLTGANSGSFKKGHSGHESRRRPIGHERICSKDGYILIKVAEPNPYTGAPTRYRHKHQVVWEAANGPIPKGHIVGLLDSNKLNCEPDNLVLLTLAQNLYLNRNGYSNLPAEARPAMLALARLATKAHELEREAG